MIYDAACLDLALKQKTLATDQTDPLSDSWKNILCQSSIQVNTHFNGAFLMTKMI